MPQPLLRFERFEDCGHVTATDQPERTFSLLKAFVLE
jgi:hypothetical protein